MLRTAAESMVEEDRKISSEKSKSKLLVLRILEISFVLKVN